MGPFKLNKVGLALAVTYLLIFIIYVSGYVKFNAAYKEIYDPAEYRAVQSMKWFLLGCPIIALFTCSLLFVASSFDSRQILLGFSGMLFLLGVGFLLIAAWLGTNLRHFSAEKGWEMCLDTKWCPKLKSGIVTFLVGSVFASLLCFGEIAFCFLRARHLQRMSETEYYGVETELGTAIVDTVDDDDDDGLHGDEHYFTNSNNSRRKDVANEIEIDEDEVDEY